MPEFVKVTFPTRRKVWVDGRPGGLTNKVFEVETGHHTFHLGNKKKNYTPSERRRNVTGTLVTDPMIVPFERTDA